MRWTFFAGLLLALSLVLGSGRQAIAQPKKTPAEEQAKELQQMIGTLLASQLYQGYLNIGFLADGRQADLYKDKQAQQVLDSIVKILVEVEKQIDKLSNLPLSAEEKGTLESMRKAFGLLRDQSKELKSYWDKKDEAHRKKFDSLRKESWEEVSKLMGLKD